MLRKLIYKVFRGLIPEIKILRKYISWDDLVDYSQDCHIAETATLFPPFKLYKVSIGDYSYINTHSKVSYVNIGKFTSIGSCFYAGLGIHPIDGLSTSLSFYSTNKVGLAFSKENKIQERKYINIGNDVFIGSNVTVLDGVTIGDGAVIGAGSVVSKDIPPYAVAVGSPIRIIKYRFDDYQIKQLLKIKWWDFEVENLRDVESMFYCINDFINKYKNREM